MSDLICIPVEVLDCGPNLMGMVLCVAALLHNEGRSSGKQAVLMLLVMIVGVEVTSLSAAAVAWYFSAMTRLSTEGLESCKVITVVYPLLLKGQKMSAHAINGGVERCIATAVDIRAACPVAVAAENSTAVGKEAAGGIMLAGIVG